MPEKNNLIIWAMPNAENNALSAHLYMVAAKSSTISNVQNSLDFDTVQAALTADESARLCLIYTAPERVLDQAIQNEEDFVRTLADWADTARKMLTLHRQNRRRSTVFEATHLHRYLNVGLARLGLHASDQTPNMPPQTHIADTPLLGMIAHVHLLNRHEVVALREELDASAQLLSNDVVLVPPLSTELALQNYCALRLRLTEAEQSGEKARDQNRTHFIKIEDAEKRVRQYQAQLDHMRTDTDAKLKDKATRIKNLEKLIEDLTRAKGESQNHVHLLKSEIDRILSSKSMRITAPLRSFFRIFGKSS